MVKTPSFHCRGSGGHARSLAGKIRVKKKKEEMKVKDRPENSCTGRMVRERKASKEN